MKKINKLVFGIGINDADYSVCSRLKGKRLWCPFYRKWMDMLRRCYSEKYQKAKPTYIGCYVTFNWLTFSIFKAWMEQQDWQGKELDKDLLCPGNKLYSPETCVFVDRKVNGFLLESNASRGEYPIGVIYQKEKLTNKFKVLCRSVLTSKQKYLGYFSTPEEAHQAWLAFKLEQAHLLAAQQSDLRVAKALIDRYENYKIS